MIYIESLFTDEICVIYLVFVFVEVNVIYEYICSVDKNFVIDIVLGYVVFVLRLYNDRLYLKNCYNKVLKLLNKGLGLRFKVLSEALSGLKLKY